MPSLWAGESGHEPITSPRSCSRGSSSSWCLWPLSSGRSRRSSGTPCRHLPERIPRLKSNSSRRFCAIFSAQIPLYGICAVLTGTLQAHEKFLWPALVPLLSSISVIATYALFGWLSGGHHEVMQVTTPQVMVLGWGTTLGVAMLSVPLFLPVARLGVRLRPGLQLPRADVRRALGLGGAARHRIGRPTDRRPRRAPRRPSLWRPGNVAGVPVFASRLPAALRRRRGADRDGDVPAVSQNSR
ncbi:hypothetical protein H8R18_03560 [Nanchangia anserum]|nr:hypothetical protein H8R18_03560 [Nanchangia anserum]